MTNRHLRGLSWSGSSAQDDRTFNINRQKYLSTDQDGVTRGPGAAHAVET